MGIPAESLPNFIGEIYDCILEPEHWGDVLAQLCNELRLMHGVLGLYVPHNGQPLLRIQHGMPKEWYDRMPEYGFEMTTFWGGLERVREYPLGEIVVHSVAHPNFDFSSNRFAQEWCQPQGIRDFAAMSVAENDNGLGTLVFTSNRLLEREDDVALLRLLSPHIRRAIAISHILDFKTYQENTIRLAVDAFPTGLLLVSATGRIVYSNPAADRQLRSNDAIKTVDGRITLKDVDLASALEAAIDLTIAGVKLSERGSGIPARGSNGTRAMLYVLPLAYGELSHRFATSATAAVFITSEGSPAFLPRQALGVLYDLTPAEVRVCELLLNGSTPNEIGSQIGVALSTVRTHLLRIFEKTGTNRQADLIRKISPLMMSGNCAPSAK